MIETTFALPRLRRRRGARARTSPTGRRRCSPRPSPRAVWRYWSSPAARRRSAISPSFRPARSRLGARRRDARRRAARARRQPALQRAAGARDAAARQGGQGAVLPARRFAPDARARACGGGGARRRNSTGPPISSCSAWATTATPPPGSRTRRASPRPSTRRRARWWRPMPAPDGLEPRLTLTGRGAAARPRARLADRGAEEGARSSRARLEDGPVEDMPIRAVLRGAADRLTVFQSAA